MRMINPKACLEQQIVSLPFFDLEHDRILNVRLPDGAVAHSVHLKTSVRIPTMSTNQFALEPKCFQTWVGRAIPPFEQAEARVGPMMFSSNGLLAW